METLRNAFLVLSQWKVIKISKPTAGKKGSGSGGSGGSGGGSGGSGGSGADKPFVVSLMAPFHEESALQQLTQRISRLRKQPPVRRGGVRRNLIADIPILAKL